MYEIVFRGAQAYKIDDEQGDIPVDSLVKFLQSSIELEEGTLFDHVWDYIARDALIFGQIFSSALGSHDLNIWVEQFKKPCADRKEEDPNDKMDYLHLFWGIDSDIFEDRKTHIREDKFYIGPDFVGTGPGKWPDGEFTDSMAYGVDFTPINDLKGYPLKLDTKISINEPTDLRNIRSKDHEFRMPELLFESNKEWTVYDVIMGILSEISFYGYPNDQIGKMAEMDQIIAKIKEDTKNGDFSSLTPLDDLFDEIEED